MQESSQVAAIILAAGKGTRMESSLPKVLHKLAGKPLLEHVLHAAYQAGITYCCAVLPEDLQPFRALMEQFPDLSICCQQSKNGTAGAVGVAGHCFQGQTPPSYSEGHYICGPQIKSEYCIILYGDTPNIDYHVLRSFIQNGIDTCSDFQVLGMKVPQPKGYGRLLLQGKQLLEIVEEKDATPDVRIIQNCNSGIILAKTSVLFEVLKKIDNGNSQNEYYLTDCIKLARSMDLKVSAFISEDWQNFVGVNTKQQLHELEQLMVMKV